VTLLFAPVISHGEQNNKHDLQNEVTVSYAPSFANGHAFGFAQDRSLTLVDLTYGDSSGHIGNFDSFT
jgi:hypothetical protein